jgi:hypothetical protein
MYKICIIAALVWLPFSSDARDQTRRFGPWIYAPASEYTRVAARGPERLLLPSANAAYSVDGLTLDLVVIYGGLPEGRALRRDRLLEESNLPTFKASMTPDEILGLYEALLKPGGISEFTVDSKLQQVGGVSGFRSEFSFLRPGGVRMKGLAYGAVVNQRLNLIIYSAPATYYFQKRLPLFESTINAIRAAPVRGAATTSDDDNPD